jgi:hypothetical protein
MGRIDKRVLIPLAIILIAVAVIVFRGSFNNQPSTTPTNNSTVKTGESGESVNCTNTPAANPTAAYIALFEAVKKRDTLAIRCQMSKQTLELANFMSQTYKKPFEEVLKNGMTESTIQPSMPEITNEKINGNQATVDVKKANGQWEQIPFVNEDGEWKLAFGEVMKGTMSITQPGATNPTLNQNTTPMIKGGPANTNMPPPVKQPVPQPPMQKKGHQPDSATDSAPNNSKKPDKE